MADVTHSALGSGGSDGVQHEGPLALDRGSHEVRLDGRHLNLTHAEFALLVALADHAGQAVASQVLLESMWGVEWLLETTSLQVHVSRLRRKLGESAREPRLLHTVRGYGYRLEWIPVLAPIQRVELLCDRDLVLLRVDPPEDFLGWSPHEIIGTVFSPAGLAPDVMRATVDGLMAVGATEVSGEARARHRDGSTVIVRARTRLFLTPEGGFGGLLLTLALPTGDH